VAAEIIRLHALGVGVKKIARNVDGADTKMVRTVLAAHTAEVPAARGGGKKKKKKAEPVSRVCANADCRKPNARKQCAGCYRVVYCDEQCQTTHWGPGGHKKYCGAAVASRPHGPATYLGMAVGSGSDTNAPECVICLEPDGELLQRGCWCRGDAGLSHLHCLIKLAVHAEQSKTMFEMAAWQECGTCKARFTGKMQHGLAEEYWARAMTLPGDHPDRIGATEAMARSLIDRGKYAEAEPLYRETLATMKRLLGDNHSMTLGARRCWQSCGHAARAGQVRRG